MRACTFFGHRDTPQAAESILESVLLNLIEKEDVRSFYVGSQGSFDEMVIRQLSELEKTHGIRYGIVLAYPPKKNSNYADDPHTIYPEGLETVPQRYAIIKRNLWMLEHSAYVVTYVRREIGNASNFKQLADKKGKTVISL
ncbi:MAG: hypothetical protein IJU96_03795 [Clostridia bacterium]|nr:hypothetical protein [Clostridia bacterium]